MADANDPSLFDNNFGDEFLVLLHRYLDSKLSDDELAALDQRLRDDPAARAEFARGLMRQALLRELVAQERSASSVAEMLDEEAAATVQPKSDDRSPIIPPLSDPGVAAPLSPDPSWPTSARSAPLGPLPGSPLSTDRGGSAGGGFAFLEIHNWRFVAFAFILLVAFGLVFWHSDDDERNLAHKPRPLVPVVAAEPVSQLDCVWLVDGKLANPQQFMTGSTVQLERGKAELRLENDVRVTMEGAVKFTLAAPDRLILVDGSATAHVPPAAVGFMVDAPAIRVTDLGTEFGVQSLPDGQAILHVFKGAVQVELADGGGSKRIIRTGQSIGARMELEQGRWNCFFDSTIKVDPASFSRASQAASGNSLK